MIRRLDSNGDRTFGGGKAGYISDIPEQTRQLILTRLKLRQGSWFLDSGAGVNMRLLVGETLKSMADQEIQRVILATPHVVGINRYQSVLDRSSRRLAVSSLVATDTNNEVNVNTGI